MTNLVTRWNAIFRVLSSSGIRMARRAMHRAGIAVLFTVGIATAPILMAAEDKVADKAPDEIIYPGKSKPVEPTRVISPPGTSVFTIVGILVLAVGGAWLFWRGRTGSTMVSRDTRQLVINETRSLGNRQFLVVASYEDRKFLLGVCPGRIDFLAPLDQPAAKDKAS